MSPSKQNVSQWIKEQAKLNGFMLCGVSKAEFLKENESSLKNWLDKSMHGEMAYMERNFKKRLDPRKLFPNCQSIISFLHSYYPKNQLSKSNNYKISKYAYGKDYHKVIKKKLKGILEQIKKKFGNHIEGRCFVDSAPIMERQWAVKSGLGWIGKNSLLINKQAGSFFFLSEILLNIQLDYDQPNRKNHCGTCTACINACPTNAIVKDRVIDARKCVSYLTTTEYKGNISNNLKNSMQDWIFGCDICQDVCPWNKFSIVHNETDFNAPEELKNFNKETWHNLTPQQFDVLFDKSPLKRPGFKNIKRNIEVQK